MTITHRTRKVLASTLVVGVLGSVSTLGIFGAFSATTQNSGNEISTGTVALSDNDAGSAMFSIANAEPGQSWSKCIKVTYAGSLPSDVRMYTSGAGGDLSEYLSLKLEQGQIAGQPAEAFPSRTGFAASTTGGTLYDGLMTGRTGLDYENGRDVTPNAGAPWATGDSLVVRMTLSLSPDMPNATQSASTGVANIIWEARNN